MYLRILLFFLSFLIQHVALSEHIVGGDIYYDYLGSNSYRITVVIYRDCASNGAEFDKELKVGIFNKSSLTRFRDLVINYQDKTGLPLVFNNPCVSPPKGICVEFSVYQAIVNLPPTPGGYIIAHQRCCRGDNITNLSLPGDTGLTLVAEIPGGNFWGNSSARFNEYPPLVICNNEILDFDHSATDPNGNELKYSLVTPFAGGTQQNPAPEIIPEPNYPKVKWRNTFSETIPLGNGSSCTIDELTGRLIVQPKAVGRYVVGIQVSEFKNGVLVASSIRDFVFIVVNCVVELTANFQGPQTSCEGLTVNFKNTSFGGNTYLWNFGDPSTSADVSSVSNPSYTYPTEGEYNVQLILNPGLPCTDTATLLIGAYPKINLKFSAQDSVCIDNNLIPFTPVYSGPDSVNFYWNFGISSNLQFDTLFQPNPKSFNRAGFNPVVLEVKYKDCYANFRDSVLIYDHARISFGIPPGVQCFPFQAVFKDSSQSISPLIYSWDLGDGTLSSDRSPIHTYQTVDTFDVTLRIIQTLGCKDTLTLVKPKLIKVSPSAQAGFDVNPKITDVYNSSFQITDKSIDAVYFKYVFDGKDSTFERNLTKAFLDGGNHEIVQFVRNFNGCGDTAIQSIYVIPEVTVYIPNTFTPDNDELNKVWSPVAYDVFYWDLTIFNRWGQIIFQSKDKNEGWDGFYNGNPAPQGIYTYLLRYKDISTLKSNELTGHINLIR